MTKPTTIQPITWQRLHAVKHVDFATTNCSDGWNMEKKGDVYSFESGAFVGVMVFMATVDHHLMATASRTMARISYHLATVLQSIVTSHPYRYRHLRSFMLAY